MVERLKMLIGGEWIDGEGSERLDSYNPFTQQVWASIPQATDTDVARAIEAAHYTFVSVWRNVNGRDRALMLNRLADLVERNGDDLARIDSTDNGKVIRETAAQMKFAARNYRYFAGYADKLQGNTIPLDNGQMFDYTIVEP